MRVVLSHREFHYDEETDPMRPKAIVLSTCLLGFAACSGGFGKIGETNPNSADNAAAEAAKKNPFLNVNFYINPEYVASVEATAKRNPAMADKIRKVAEYPSAIWLDSISAIPNIPKTLDEAKKQQAASGKPTLSVFIVYDLPNRDCSANSSAGELRLDQNGEARYINEYIAPIKAHFQAYPDQPIVAVIEPDSLGNLATNMGLPTCSAAAAAYKKLTAHAIKELALPNVSLYLDAAHAGWLGWDGNREKIVSVYKSVLKMAGGPHLIRGFATNVSNYTHLYNHDGKILEPTNPCFNELEYAKKLLVTLSMSGIKNKAVIIDTARNGRGNIRKKWGYWCNIRGAGLGERPQAAPRPDIAIDAYFWLKPPGESDGVSDSTQPRFDPECTNPDSVRDAPQAGKWFEKYFLDLVNNAEPPL